MAKKTITDFAPLKKMLSKLPVELDLDAKEIEKKQILFPANYIQNLIDGVGTNKKYARQVIKMLITVKEDQDFKTNAEKDYFFINEKPKDPNPRKGLTRMYEDRVLVSPSGACMVHCPWCFRDERSGFLKDDDLEDIVNYIEKDKRIHDVILTGGEPFLFPIDRLSKLIDDICSIPAVRILRFHTRAPVVAPDFFSEQVLDILEKNCNSKQRIYIVTQVIHPLEISNEVADNALRLSKTGCMLLNQAPVLDGVNDDQDTFNEWNIKLIQAGIKPYYVIIPIIRNKRNSRYFVPYKKITKLVSRYSSGYDGLGRPTIIFPVMKKKISQFDLEELMSSSPGVHYRNTKAQIWN